MGAQLAVGGAGPRRVRPAMNVTPLVDVVLVLLIIFMVIAPMMVKQFWIHVPKKAAAAAPEPATPDDDVSVVLVVRADGSLWINQDRIELAELPTKLARIFAARDQRLLFFDAADDVSYGTAMAALDAARGGGAVNVAVLTESVLR